MPVDTYDPAMCLTTAAGMLMQGFAAGTFVSVEHNADAFTLQVGADGETARVRSNDRSAVITLTLMQTSDSNDLLSAAADADRSLGTGVFPFMLRDALGRTRVMAPNTWVKKKPTIEFGNELGTREWKLETDYLSDAVVGGAL